MEITEMQTELLNLDNFGSLNIKSCVCVCVVYFKSLSNIPQCQPNLDNKMPLDTKHVSLRVKDRWLGTAQPEGAVEAFSDI